MRIGLGCMRLSTDADRDDARSIATVRAALAGGAVRLDTAHAYGLDDGELGHNERLVARAVLGSGVDPATIRIVTKCGMRRPEGGWRPDGRASAIAEDVRGSVDALAGIPIDALLLHAVDPKTPLVTSVRALSRAMESGQARSIGLSNVSLPELQDALRVAPIAAVEVALGAFDDAAARGGIVRFCGDHGIEVLAHSPLGGPKRASRLARDAVLSKIAMRLGATPAEVFLAFLCHANPAIVPLVGARRPETAASALRADALLLDERALVELAARFPALSALRTGPPRPPAETHREVVLIMGIAGAGKSEAARQLVERGYARLNRDELGGTLRGIARKLEERLAAGEERFVADNTYLTRASRNHVIVAAHEHGAHVRCVFLSTPLEQAQINVVLRMLHRHAALLGPEEITRFAKKDPGLVRPTVLYRMVRELEPPSVEEGFSTVDIVPFERRPHPGHGRSGAMIPLEAAQTAAAPPAVPVGLPTLLFAWQPGADESWFQRANALADDLRKRTRAEVDVAVCNHPAGPPVCWCRPPLPGLWLAFAERHCLDPRQSILVSRNPVHASMARTLGLDVVVP